MALGAVATAILLTVAPSCVTDLCPPEEDASVELEPPGLPASGVERVLAEAEGLDLASIVPVLEGLLSDGLPGPASSLGPEPSGDPGPGPGNATPSEDHPSETGGDPGPAGPGLPPVSPVHVAPVDSHAGATTQGEAVHAPPAPPGPEARGSALTQGGTGAIAGLALALVLIALYHRLDRERLLSHDARLTLLDRLSEDPGQGTSQLARELGCCYRTARHHLEMLARFNLVVCLERKGKRVWCLPEDANRVRTRLTPEEGRVLELVERAPGVHLSAVAKRLGLAKSTAKLHLERLVEMERLEDERVGPLRRFFVPDQVE